MGDLDRVSKLSEGHFLTRLDTRDRVNRRERQDPGSQQGHTSDQNHHKDPESHPDVVELHVDPALVPGDLTSDQLPANQDSDEPDPPDRPAHLDISA